MVALFLRTELPAARHPDDLRALLEREGLPEHVITNPTSATTPRTRRACGYRTSSATQCKLRRVTGKWWLIAADCRLCACQWPV